MPTTTVLVGSLLALIATGWEKSDSLKLIVSALAVPLFVGALVKAFGITDFSSPRFIHGTAKQLAWIRIVVCFSVFTLTVIEDLPAISRLPAGFRSNHQFFHLLNILFHTGLVPSR